MKSTKNNCLRVAWIAGVILLLATLNISAAEPKQDSKTTTPATPASKSCGARTLLEPNSLTNAAIRSVRIVENL